MSYHKVRLISIREDEGKVFITGCDNNVYPRTPRQWKCTSLSEILIEQGREAVDLEILKAYESGDFQGGANKYTKALEALWTLPEYQSFNWRGEPFDEIHERRKTPEYMDLLKKALTIKLPKPLRLVDGMMIRLKSVVKFTNGSSGQIFKVNKPQGRRRKLFIRYVFLTSGDLQPDTYSMYRLPASCLKGAELLQAKS